MRENRVIVCTARDRDYEWYIRANQAAGHTVYEDPEKPGIYFVMIDRSNVWMAPDVEFQYMPSGVYVFDDNGKPQRVQ